MHKGEGFAFPYRGRKMGKSNWQMTIWFNYQTAWGRENGDGGERMGYLKNVSGARHAKETETYLRKGRGMKALREGGGRVERVKKA